MRAESFRKEGEEEQVWSRGLSVAEDGDREVTTPDRGSCAETERSLASELLPRAKRELED
jgi:hypothetical protein